ncbi:unnamed protein product [Caenorhabditis brenneri]
MSKQRTTTASSIYVISYGKSSNQLTFLNEVFNPSVLITYGSILGPLAVCFLCCLPPYIKAFKRNLAAHAVSPLLVLVTHSFRTLKFNYPTFFVFGIISGMFCFSPASMVAGRYVINMALIFGLAIVMYVSMYQLAISLISIHRFFDNRQPVELRSSLTRKNVIVLMILLFLIEVLNYIGAYIAIFVIILTGKWELYIHVAIYNCSLYIAHQILLFIGMAFQFSMSSVPTTSHSENVIVTHTKQIGATKFVLLIIAVLSYITGFETTVAVIMFFSIDVFLVPLIIELTEIRASPTATMQSNNVIVPCEIVKQPVQF